MIGNGDYLLEGILGTVHLHDLPNKFGTPGCNEVFGLSKTGHNFLANEASDGSGSMVSGCPCYWPTGKVVDGCDDIFLPKSVFGKRSNNAKGPLLKGFHGLDGSDRLGGACLDMFFLQHTSF